VTFSGHVDISCGILELANQQKKPKARSKKWPLKFRVLAPRFEPPKPFVSKTMEFARVEKVQALPNPHLRAWLPFVQIQIIKGCHFNFDVFILGTAWENLLVCALWC